MKNYSHTGKRIKILPKGVELGNVFETITLFKKLIIIILLIPFPIIAQKPHGQFLKDTIKIGLPIDYALSFSHNASDEVFFPDTSYNFYPFELVRRDIFTTKTTKQQSIDSAVYTLVSFDINKIQSLKLPIFLLSKKDCTAIYSNIDSVLLSEMIKTDIHRLEFKSDTNIIPLKQQINYLKIFYFILGLILFFSIIYAFLGNYIKKRYALFLFDRKHIDFQNNFKRYTTRTLDDKNIGKLLVLWKKHLEWLEKKPYTSYTSKEIISRLPNENLEEALRDIDTAIYGGILSDQMLFSMKRLLTTATTLYKERRIELAEKQ